jgi:hypothetical protein
VQEKTQLQKTLDVAAGKALASELKAPTADQVAAEKLQAEMETER